MKKKLSKIESKFEKALKIIFHQHMQRKRNKQAGNFLYKIQKNYITNGKNGKRK